MYMHSIKTYNISFNRLEQELFNEVPYIFLALLGDMLKPENIASLKIMTLFSISIFLW
jgi:hypothetical protein